MPSLSDQRLPAARFGSASTILERYESGGSGVKGVALTERGQRLKRRRVGVGYFELIAERMVPSTSAATPKNPERNHMVRILLLGNDFL